MARVPHRWRALITFGEEVRQGILLEQMFD
jgi:hypothetical protein